MKKISFVIPCYNSEYTIEGVVNEIRQKVREAQDFDYEIILVNDGSRDNTFDVLSRIHAEDDRVVSVDLLRNFGQASAQMAGFGIATGDYVFSLDDDGQMPIESVFDLTAKIEEGYDVVFGAYEAVKQSVFRNIGSQVNVKMTEIMLGKPKELYISSFWVARKAIIDEIVKYTGPYPYIGGLLLRTTKRMTSVKVIQRERKAGQSNYTFVKLLGLWLNGFTAFSIVPLRIVTGMGFGSAVLGVLFGLFVIIRKLLDPTILLGYSSIIVIMLVIGGMMMLSMGMLGEYIGRIYLNINQAPQYIIRTIEDRREASSEVDR